MNKAYWEYLYTNTLKSEFLDQIGLENLGSETIIDFDLEYSDIQNAILSEPDKSHLFPLAEIPFERLENIQLAALSGRIDPKFYLKNTSEIKNLSFLGESHTIHYNNDNLVEYISAINPSVNLEKTKIENLDDNPLAIHQGTLWSQNSDLIQLNPLEFTPGVADGILCLICHKDNTPVRQSAAEWHHKNIMSISNLERSIQQKTITESIELIACHVYQDDNKNHHGIACIKKDNALKYVDVSQSTIFEFGKNMMKNILDL
jgi:hypothetical protein